MLEELGQYYHNYGLKLSLENHLTLAAEALEKAALINKNSSDTRNVLGLCYYRLGEFKKAQEIWKESITLFASECNPAYRYIESMQEDVFLDMSLQYNKALELAENKSYKKAVKTLMRNSVYYESNVKAINLLGLLMFELGRTMAAVKLWRQALLLDRENKAALRYLCEAAEKPASKFKIFRFFNFIKKEQ